MLFDMERLEAQNCYKILASTVTPRPIAWVTTLSEDGVVNAAPYSFFNALGHEPPTLALGLLAGKGRFKDTATNILASGEFVVNLVSEKNAAARAGHGDGTAEAAGHLLEAADQRDRPR